MFKERLVCPKKYFTASTKNNIIAQHICICLFTDDLESIRQNKSEGNVSKVIVSNVAYELTVGFPALKGENSNYANKQTILYI